MEVVTSLPNGMNGTSGGTKKHIQEWSRLDKFTGMLEHARVEADHWASTTSNSRHHFGKVVDSRARNLADGSVQQKHQTKQLEVFQAQIPGGSVQVIRSHTSTTSSWHNSKVIQSHSSSWSSNSSGNVLNHANKMGTEIDDLKFEHNPVNLDSEKTKVNVARQLTNRRPPTRSRISKTSSNDSSFTNLPITYFSNEGKEAETNISSAETESSKKKLPNNLIENDLNHSSMELNRQKLGEKKSVSDENLSITSQLNDEKLEEKENSDPWIRSSKTRWSFQYPSRYKNKLTENPTEKNQNNKSELESVLEKVLRRKGDFDSYSKIPCELDTQKPLLLRKKSFVTEKTLQETKRKLRHMNFDKILSKNRETDNHGFIENENNPNDKNESINGNQKYKSGTSEYQLTNCSESRNINKTNDWFDRRKSYGFESVGIQHSTSALNDIPKTNSSIDSGICQSSELEFASTSMIKKMTAGSEDRLQTSNFENTQYHEFPTKNEVSELMQKFEKFDKSRHAATTPTLVEKSKYNVPDIAGSQQDVIEKGKVLQTVKNFEKNGVYCKTSEPLIFTKTNSYNLEPTPKTSTSDFSTSEQDFLFKRHSIACDDIKYMNPTFANSERPFPEKITLPGQFTVINVNNFEPNLTQLCSVDNDNKKPKKVEFSKTEVHFAATEPGKIKIVETDEKPPPANLYRRKKRSVSVSPKSELSQNKLNESDKRLSDDVVNQRLNDGTVFNPEFTSTATDNGLAVTISSIKPTNYRRASWSVIENSSPVQLDNKAGYSTKINFGGERIIVVADSKSPQHEMVHQSIAGSKDTEDEIRNTDASQNVENIQEKLIVRIGGSGSGYGTMEKYVQKPTFINSFRNSIKSSKTTGTEKLSEKNNLLKSTSLIIETIKKSMIEKTFKKTNVEKMEKIDYVKNDKRESITEQPSTYITEMNKLQRRYQSKENQEIANEVLKSEKHKNRFYHTVPVMRNGAARAKLITDDLPVVLGAFSDLCRTIDEVMNKKTERKVEIGKQKDAILDEMQVPVRSFDKYSSHSKFLSDILRSDDGNISDDSMKADKEVQSYMSTAIMEEYENELSGSWSRKRYFKHIKPIKVVEQDISEKSYFKPLKTDEDKLKIITNASDVKKPKIASIAIKLDDSWADDKSSGNSKQCSTILLNKSNDNSNSTFLNENISGEINDHVNEKRISPECKTESPLKMYDIGETDKGNELKEHESSKVIYHNLKIKSKEQSVVNGNEKKNHSPKKNDNSEKNRKKSSSKEVGNNCSMKRRTNHIINKEKLPNSGRDGWLNLPKERKPTFEKNKVDHEKHELHRKPYSDRAKKSERTNMSGCGDITSEEDFPRKNKLYKPLQKIDEKIKITDTSPKLSYTKNRSNQTVENRSNMFESRNPVLKTEERSRRRAARMLHSISNREAVNSNMASSSDDITSENEMNYSRCSKPRIVRKAKLSPKNRNPVSTANLPASNKVVTSTASMQINIFNIKNRTDNEKRNSRLYTSGLKIGDNVSSKSTFFAGQREVPSNLSEKKIRPTLSSNRNSKKNSSSSLKSTRLVH